MAWAAPFSPRTGAIEGATGMGALIAQQLVAAGEHVVDVPPKLSSRVRLLERGTGRSLTVAKAEQLLAIAHIDRPVTSERVDAANELLDEVYQRLLDETRN